LLPIFQPRINQSFRAFLNALATSGNLNLHGHRKIPAASTGVPMRGLIARFLADQSGATAIEYCLIACGIALAIIGTVQGIGPQLATKFTAVNASLR
jgi:pilus assembly protein Flp/PilA